MDSVLTLAVDRRRLITASLDRTIRVFDSRDGRTIHKLCGHKVLFIISFVDRKSFVYIDSTIYKLTNMFQ